MTTSVSLVLRLCRFGINKISDQKSDEVNSNNVWCSDYVQKALFSGILIFKRVLTELCQI